MKDELFELLNDLTALRAPSTREVAVQRWLDRYLQSKGYGAQGDAQGNLWCSNRREGGLKCGIIAHADEIGIQITSIETPGIARFRKIGGLRAPSLLGHKIVFTNTRGEAVTGIVGCDPIQNNGTETGIMVRTSDLWVDIGAESAEEFSTRLNVGDFATFEFEGVERLSENRIIGKAFDDRCGLSVVIKAFDELAGRYDNLELILISSVQEELNLFGSKSMPVNLDVAIVVDVDFASDTPSDISDLTNLVLGRGIGVCINADNQQVLSDMLLDVCREQGIPFQTTVGRSFSGGTDAAALRLKNATATVNINIPLRYMHTSHEMLDLRDLEWGVKAVIAMVEKLSILSGSNALIPWKN